MGLQSVFTRKPGGVKIAQVFFVKPSKWQSCRKIKDGQTQNRDQEKVMGGAKRK